MSEGTTRISGLWVLAALIVGILIVGDLTRRMTDARRMEREAASLSTQVMDLEAANAELQSLIAGADDDSNVARWARSEARLIRDGEILVVPLPVDDTLGLPDTSLESELEPPTKWEVWWALLIGG